MKTPGQLRVFPVSEEGFGEELVVWIGDVFECFAAQQQGGGGAAENPGRLVVTTVVRFAGAWDYPPAPLRYAAYHRILPRLLDLTRRISRRRTRRLADSTRGTP